MRVLFVVGNLGDYQVPRFQALVRLAARRRHEVSLVEVFGKSGLYGFPQEGRAAFFNARPDMSVTLIEDAAEGDGHSFQVGMRLFTTLREFAPDVVVTLGYSTNYSIILCLLKLLTRRFGLIYMSDSKADDGKRYGFKERLKRALVSRFDGALVAGEKHRIYAQSLGIPLARSRIGFDVIDVEHFSRTADAARANAPAVRKQFGLPPRYVLCVSRFVERKNIDVLIEAYARSNIHTAGISLVLVGQGPDEPQLQQQIGQLGMSEHVVILSSLSNPQMPNLYALAEFAVLASKFDQWGLCVNEAFAAGRPAIVTQTCGVANELVIDGINGFVVEPGDAAALTDRIRLLAMDTALRERFAASAASTIRRWTPSLFAANIIELAESMVDKAGRPQELTE